MPPAIVMFLPTRSLAWLISAWLMPQTRAMANPWGVAASMTGTSSSTFHAAVSVLPFTKLV
jgi:hypothetical protein